jgi:hypothetical protein
MVPSGLAAGRSLDSWIGTPFMPDHAEAFWGPGTEAMVRE